jgi:Ca-activated chloride channel family protein
MIDDNRGLEDCLMIDDYCGIKVLACLIIDDDRGRKEYPLTESVYSIGRDPKSNIRLFSLFVSKKHAILIRRYHEDGSFYYKIVDGNLKGKLSDNGLLINGQKLERHDLKDEDKIEFGPGVSAEYRIINGTLDKSSTPMPTSFKPTKDTLSGLYVQSPDGKQQFPLKHTEVQAKIAGNLSRVELTQTFENPFTQPLEAIYVFPLPDEAAVDDMEIKIGDRIIKGDIKKREEAQAIYEEAKQQGRTAGLLEQERDNIFTQSLANIKPGEQIDVTIRYTDSLKFEGGNYEFVFPMVVAPRFIPGTAIDDSGDTDVVPDASKITPPIIPPATRSGHDIGVTVEIDAGIPISNVRSTSHQLQIEHDGQIVRVNLGKSDTIPNKDLILRYQVSGDHTEATILTQADEKGGHFAVYLIPALDYNTDEIVAKDVVFLMDTSGSQHGDPLQKCQELMRRFINGLNPNDTFSIIDFSDTTEQLSAAPLPNTPKNRSLAISYINRLTANGGTYLLPGIQAVLKFPASAGRLRSIVLLTDGYIGNENEILAELQRELKPGNRLYSFGVGSSTNRFLLNRIAEIGRGTSQIVRQNEPTEEVAEKFFRQINNPVLTNIEIAFEGTGEMPILYPSIAPDLFAEQPLVLFGRKLDKTAGNLCIKGTAAGGKAYEKTFNLNFEQTGNPAVAQLWGRARIKELMKEMLNVETTEGVEAVTDTALTYQLLSQYTAFVAVSDDVRVNPEDASVSMQVPVEMPEGVSYNAVFSSVDSSQSASLQSPSSYARGISNVKSGAMDMYDITLISPGMMMPDNEEVNLPSSLPSQLEIISVTNLDTAATNVLKSYLQQLSLPSGFSGEIVFEFPVNKGRVTRVMLEKKASTLTEATVIDLIKRSLLAWQVPVSAAGTIRLTLRIHS